MRNKIGRNDPCACGSGKKFKHCCAGAPPSPTTLARERLRTAEGRLVDASIRYARQRYASSALAELAWEDLTLGDEFDQEDEDLFRETMFPIWITFDWCPDPEDWPDIDLPKQPLALEAIARHPERFDSLEQRLASTLCRTPYSFYSVIEVQPGTSMGLRNILTGQQVTVLELQASRVVKPSQILFTRVIEMDGIALMVGCAPLPLSPRRHHVILDLRTQLAQDFELAPSAMLTEDILTRVSNELREFYFDMAFSEEPERTIEMLNSDGEPLLPTKVYFTLQCTPQEAFSALKDLALDNAEQADGARYDSAGNLQAVNVSWFRDSDAADPTAGYITLGCLRIDGEALTAEVDSQARAARIRGEIERRLVGKTLFQSMSSQPLNTDPRHKQPADPGAAQRAARSEELRNDPRAQAIVKQMIAKHYATWIDTPLKVLKGLSPRQAASTQEGREHLEVILLEMSQLGDNDPLLRPDLDKIRRDLGM